jgi:hypothetical protein
MMMKTTSKVNVENLGRTQIALRKVNEVEYVNARTFWEVWEHRDHGHPITAEPETYSLRIKHRYPEDSFKYVVQTMDGEELEPLTRSEFNGRIAEIEEHETGDDFDAAVEKFRESVVIWDDGDYRWSIYRHLHDVWTAVCMVSSPVTNMF